jgi:hypothetical protein
VATWAREFGFVSIHDPLTGEWHDVPMREASGWALSEASTRKALWRAGDRQAFSYNSRQMGEIWERSHRPVEQEQGDSRGLRGGSRGPVG